MAELKNKRTIVKVGNRPDKIAVINQNTVSQAEYNKELGRVLLIASYQSYIDKQVITPAIDLEVYSDYARPTKALQDLMAIESVLKKIEKEPLKANKEAQKYTYDKLMATAPKTVQMVQAQGQNGAIMLEARQHYVNTVLAKINIGPRGGLNYVMADKQKFIQAVVSKFDVVAQKLIEETMTNAPADIGSAYQTLLNCVKTGEKIPETCERVTLKMTGTADEAGNAKDIVVHLMAKDKEIGTFGIGTGNIKTRRLSMVQLADIEIPKAATIEVQITK